MLVVALTVTGFWMSKRPVIRTDLTLTYIGASNDVAGVRYVLFSLTNGSAATFAPLYAQWEMRQQTGSGLVTSSNYSLCDIVGPHQAIILGVPTMPKAGVGRLAIVGCALDWRLRAQNWVTIDCPNWLSRLLPGFVKQFPRDTVQGDWMEIPPNKLPGNSDESLRAIPTNGVGTPEPGR